MLSTWVLPNHPGETGHFVKSYRIVVAALVAVAALSAPAVASAAPLKAAASNNPSIIQKAMAKRVLQQQAVPIIRSVQAMVAFTGGTVPTTANLADGIGSVSLPSGVFATVVGKTIVVSYPQYKQKVVISFNKRGVASVK